MRISKKMDVDVELDMYDIIGYIRECSSQKELLNIKSELFEVLEEAEECSVNWSIRNTQNYETAKEAFFKAANRNINLNLLTDILNSLS